LIANIQTFSINNVQNKNLKINNSYPDFHSLALNAKQLDVLLQPNLDNIEYVSVSKLTYVVLVVGLCILVFVIVICKISFKLYKQNTFSMNYIKTLLTVNSIDEVQEIEIK